MTRDSKLPDDDMNVSKHIAVQIAQRDCCGIYTVMVLIVCLVVIMENTKRYTVQVLK